MFVAAAADALTGSTPALVSTLVLPVTPPNRPPTKSRIPPPPPLPPIPPAAPSEPPVNLSQFLGKKIEKCRPDEFIYIFL